MATSEEKRVWLRDNGYEPPPRGMLRKDLTDIYDAAHPGAADDEAGDDVSRETSPDEPAPDTAESRPQRPRRGRPSNRTRADVLVDKLLGGPARDKTSGKQRGRGKPKTRKPRVSLDKFVTRAYTRLGQMTATLAPATGRCLQAQAAMAGVILEDVARDTFADRLMQPLARAEDKLDKVFALTAPPVLVFALEMMAQPPPGQLPTPDMIMRRQILMMMLRESLFISLEITEQYAEQIQVNLERNAENEAKVETMMAQIFGMPQAQAEPDDMTSAEQPAPAAA